MTTSETVRTIGSIRLESEATCHEFAAPADPDAVTDAFAAVMGASPARRVALTADVTAVAALALAVLVDETRRDSALALAAGTECVLRGVVASQVAPLVDTVAERAPGVTSVVRTVVAPAPIDCNSGAVSDAFDELAALGLVTREQDRYVPAGAIRELAPSCLRISASAEFASARGTRHVVQFGVQDLLVAERTGDRISVATTSAAEVIAQARAFLTLAG